MDFFRATKATNIRDIGRTLNFKPSRRALGLHIAVDAAILYLVYVWLHQGSALAYWAAQFALPVLFFRFFALMHDCVHSSAISTRRSNDWLGHFCGAMCFLPFYPWKVVHLEHHNWAGNVEKDPVMKLVRDYDPNKTGKNGLLNFFWQSWIPVMAMLQHVVFWVAGLKCFGKARQKGEVLPFVLSYVIPVFVYGALFISGIFHPLNFLPGLLLYLALVEIINLPHHLSLNQYRGDHKIPVFEQYEISRSCVYPKWFARHIVNNFNLHAEHHMFPRLPWHRLDEVQPATARALGSVYNSCKNNDWILANRRRPIGHVLVFNSANESATDAATDVKKAA